MVGIASVLGDRGRWRIIELLSERPRCVGELADLTGLRQPQTTKHLKTLAGAGLVAVYPLGQRRVYAIETAPLKALENRLQELIASSEAQAGERDVIARYRAALEAEAALADREGWADGRAFSFERTLAADPEVVWRHWVDKKLLASWCAPPPMTVASCMLEPRRGGRALLDYRDAERRYLSEGRVHEATQPTRLVFDLSVHDADGARSFISRFDLSLSAILSGTLLRLDMRIAETTVEAVPYIAGIETGWGQVLDNLAGAVGKAGAPRRANRRKGQAR